MGSTARWYRTPVSVIPTRVMRTSGNHHCECVARPSHARAGLVKIATTRAKGDRFLSEAGVEGAAELASETSMTTSEGRGGPGTRAPDHTIRSIAGSTGRGTGAAKW